MITARRTRLQPDSAEAQTMGRCNKAFFKYLRTEYLTEKRKRSRDDSEGSVPSTPSKRARTIHVGSVNGGECPSESGGGAV